MAGYRYENYRSEPSDRPLAEVLLASPLPPDWSEEVERSRIVAEAVANVRDWVNQTGPRPGPRRPWLLPCRRWPRRRG